LLEAGLKRHSGGGTVVRDGVRYHQLPAGWAGPRAGQLLFHALLLFAARRVPHDLWIESFTQQLPAAFLPRASGGIRSESQRLASLLVIDVALGVLARTGSAASPPHQDR
jgi:hypothetical protein